MSTEVAKNQDILNVDFKEFKLDEKQAITVKNDFLPYELELTGYMQVYNHVITQEISKETAKQASELRKKLVKVRTGSDKVREAAKNYHLQAGRYIDALYKVIKEKAGHMEELLSGIENFEAIQKAKDEAALKEKREILIAKFEPNLTQVNLGTMTEEDFIEFQRMVELAFLDRKAREKKAEEDLHKQTVFNGRERQLLPYSSFEDITGLTVDTTEEQFQLLLNKCISAKAQKDAVVVAAEIQTGIPSTPQPATQKAGVVVTALQKDKLKFQQYRQLLSTIDSVNPETEFGKKVKQGLESMNTKVVAWLDNQLTKM